MSGNLNLANWRKYQHLFVPTRSRTIAGISGGSTSGMMAALLDQSVLMSFQNTGKEHPRTYEFLTELMDAMDREIVWLEYRPPATVSPRRNPRAQASGRTGPAVLVRVRGQRHTRADGR